MKTFKVHKRFSPKTKPSFLIDEGSYPITEWRNDGFVIGVTPLGTLIPVFISHGEVAAVGKVIVGFGDAK